MPNQANQQKKPVQSYDNMAKLKLLSREESDNDCLYLAPDLFEQDPAKIEEMAKRINQELTNILCT